MEDEDSVLVACRQYGVGGCDMGDFLRWYGREFGLLVCLHYCSQNDGRMVGYGSMKWRNRLGLCDVNDNFGILC